MSWNEPLLFCAGCGASVGAQAYCPNCGRQQQQATRAPAAWPTVPAAAAPTVATPVGPPPAPSGPPQKKGNAGWIVAVVLAFVVVAGGATGATVLATRGSGHHRTVVATRPAAATPTTAPPATVAPAAATSSGNHASAAPVTANVPTPLIPGEGAAASQIASIIGGSNSARSTVVAATQAVTACTGDPDSEADQVGSAISQREQDLSQLSDVPASDLPNGEALISDLQSALQASDTADQDYTSWMNDVEDLPCPYPTTADSNFQAASQASSEATGAKESFVSLWNPIASRLGLSQYSQDQI